jgi:hypothetical protein
MMVSWEVIFSKLKPAFDALSGEVAKAHPQVRTRMGQAPAEHYPFNAYLSFDLTGEPGHEDLVVSVHGKRVEAGLELSSDIARGDGYVLSDGPGRRVPLTQEAGEALLRWADEVADYVRTSSTLVVEALTFAR